MIPEIDDIEERLRQLERERVWLDSPAHQNNLRGDRDIVERVHKLFAALWDEGQRDNAAAALVAFCKQCGWHPDQMAVALPGEPLIEQYRSRHEEAWTKIAALMDENRELREVLSTLNDISRQHYQALAVWRKKWK